MARPNPIAAAITARIARKKYELVMLEANLDRNRQTHAELLVRQEGIRNGIQEDTQLLENAKPKRGRNKLAEVK